MKKPHVTIRRYVGTLFFGTREHPLPMGVTVGACSVEQATRALAAMVGVGGCWKADYEGVLVKPSTNGAENGVDG